MQKEIENQIKHASHVVKSWPDWKRNILTHSLEPTNSVARTPVQYDRKPGGTRYVFEKSPWWKFWSNGKWVKLCGQCTTECQGVCKR